MTRGCFVKKKNIFVHIKKKMFMRIKYGLILLFLFPFFSLLAQKDPQFSLFPWTQPFYNPGAMGEKEQHLNFIGVFRQGDVFTTDDGNKNSPSQDETGNNSKPKPVRVDQQQIFLNIDSYIKQIKGAVGIMFLKDKIGFEDNIAFRLGYAAKLPLRGGKLGIGVQFGFLNKKLSPTYISNNPEDDLLKESDKASTLDFDMNFGLHYKAPTWYVGLSCNQIIGGVRISGEKSSFNPVRNLYAMGGYIWNLNTPVPWSVEPSLLIQSDFATWSFGLMALARYNGILWFGASYQIDNGIAVLLGALPFYNKTNPYLKGLEVGFAYTFQTKTFSWQPSGSWGDFEVLIRYGFNFYTEKPLTGYGSSRHLYKNQY
jgi:type IX secretion system PorP/SprF family membrane protein